MTCDIVMVTWNEAQITERALKSIFDHSAYPYRLIVVDNASDADTVALLERAAKSGEFGEMILIRNNENHGWVKAINEGLTRSDAPYVCFINNDIVAGPGWLRNVVQLLESNPQFGLANPRGKNRSTTFTLPGTHRFIELDYCCGFCLVVKREVVDKIGGLDEIYHPGYFDDNDYSRKAQKAGYLCVQSEEAHVFHHQSVSFNKLPGTKKQLMERHREIFRGRWGVPRRLLVLPQCADNENFMTLARAGHKLYVVENRFCGRRSFPHRHVNIKFLKSPPGKFGQALYFLWKAYHFRRKHRIDNAVIQFGKLVV